MLSVPDCLRLTALPDFRPPPDVPDSVRSRLIRSLGRWHFEPHMLPDEEAIACSLILFEALFRVEGMREAVPVSLRE